MDNLISQKLADKLEKSDKNFCHIIMIATKPDIVKQASLYLELKKRWELVVLVHTGQHYDYNLSTGVLEEFWMEVDINLNISWSLHHKYATIVENMGDIYTEIYEKYKKLPVPYVHWDTLSATTADKPAFLNRFWVVHVEAGIRTFTLNRDVLVKHLEANKSWNFDFEEYRNDLKNIENFSLGSCEPFPEQFDTRTIWASTWFFAVPVELNKQTLLWEGFNEDRMKVVWNTVSDVVSISRKKTDKSTFFKDFPTLKWKDFVFITIHRRENTLDERRFKAMFYAIKKLVESWVYVCFLGLYASEDAIDKFGLRDEMEALEKFENLVYAPALAHHYDVVEALLWAWVLLTDSWSMQEEANILWTKCVTLRFWSDRSETFLEWCNFLAPPLDADFIFEVTKNVLDMPKFEIKNIYWENVAWKIVDGVLEILEKEWELFRFDDKRLDLEKYYNY